MKIDIIGLDKTISAIKEYKASLEIKQKRMLEKLAEIGIKEADMCFHSVHYDGEYDISLFPVWVDDNTLAVTAQGSSLLFIEFGSGLIGYGHPLAEEKGYGPGTWSDNESLGGKGQWDNPAGWIYAHDENRSFGNEPARGMYNASKKMRNNIATIAREVFNDRH